MLAFLQTLNANADSKKGQNFSDKCFFELNFSTINGLGKTSCFKIVVLVPYCTDMVPV
jgi:hypothetical protein